MELVRLAQLYKAKNQSKEEKVELAQKIDIPYCIPNDTFTDLQEQSYVGYNCLHLAALKLDFDYVGELLKCGADFLKQGAHDHRTPLHVAVNVKTNCNGKKLWEISGKLQDCQIVNTLLLAHVSSSNPFNVKCKNGTSHFHIACMFNCVEAVQFYLKNGEPINQVTSADALWPSYTPLHFAIRYSSVETTRILLNNGTDLFAKDAEGISPLQMLISRVLHVSDYINMGQRTIIATYEEDLERVEEIVGMILKLNSVNNVNPLNETGLTVFHVACVLRDSSIAASFLNDNLNLNMSVNSKFWPGWTPLHFAACSSAETVKLLIQRGADITVKNKKGETPLDFCLKRYTPAVVHSILSTRDEFKSILLSDKSARLLDLLLAMNDITSFNNYLKNLVQTDITVNHSSLLLPGYSLLHLVLSMNERTKSWYNFHAGTDSQENLDFLPKVYNCAANESHFFLERIRACLTAGCSVDLKNSDGLIPVHFAFGCHFNKPGIFEKLLNISQENEVDPNGLSHLHIACAVGNLKAVQRLLNVGANIGTVVKESFQRYRRPDLSSSLISVNANSTPLHVAVAFGQTRIIEILLSRGADIYAIDSKGFTPIHLSITQSTASKEVAKAVIGKPKKLIEIVTKEGLSHLHVAAFAGDAIPIDKLIRSSADVNKSVDAVVPDFLSHLAGKTPLQMATRIRGNVAQAVRVLIESGANIYVGDTLQCLMGEADVDYSRYFVDRLKLNENVTKPIDSSGLTLMHVACSKFDIDWATKLLDRGADVNARIRNDEDYRGRWKGYTALHALVARKYRNEYLMKNAKAIVLGKSLLDRGADVRIDSVDGTPLHMAYRGWARLYKEKEHSFCFVDWLVGVTMREVYQIPLFRTLQERVMSSLRRSYGRRDQPWKDELAASMLHSPQNHEVNPISRDGLSHFHFFCMMDEKAAMARQCLDNGVDVNQPADPFPSKGFAGNTALHFAIACQAFEAANMLVERGADVNVENAEGNTPLHLMIKQGLIDDRRTFLETLKRHGANFNVKNLRGETPADILITKHRFKLEQFRFMMENGSMINVEKAVAEMMRNARVYDRPEIFKLFVGVSDIRATMKNGYDPIQDIVNCDGTHLTADEYL